MVPTLVKSADLLKAVKSAGKTRAKRSPLPILGSVLLVKDEDTLSVYSTDLDRWAVASCHLGTTDKSAWSVCINRKPLQDWLSVVADKQEYLRLEPTKDTLTLYLSSMPMQAQFIGFESAEYPQFDPAKLV